jgi:hypothetical protein
MKKIILSLLFITCAFLVNAQTSTPRFGTTSSGDNTGRVLTYGYVAPTYAATYNIVPKCYETTVKMGTLTGALTLTSSITQLYAADKLSIIFTADGTNRVVTFSTGFASGGNITVNASTTMTVNFVFNGTTGWVQQTANDLVFGLAGDGSVGAPSIGFASDTDNGLYRIGANNYGASAAGAKVLDISATGLGVTGLMTVTTSIQAGTTVITDAITEKTSGGGITFSKATIRKNTATAINTTATVTAAQLAGGLLTSTSAAAVTMTLPTATALATQLGAVQGTVFDFVVDNSAGSNTVTVAVGSGIVASGFPGTNTLTLANSATIGVATFRIVFISTTAATLTRIS